MKTKFLFLFFMGLLFSNLCYAQFQDASTCGTREKIADNNQLPYYMRTGFGTEVVESLAVVYVDFPDGRVSRTDQVFNKSQLGAVSILDAVAELGIDSVGGTLAKVPAKYTYFDRWEMFFSTGTYYGNVHPDFGAYGHVAYGSMKEWFAEVSNDKYVIVPAITHPPDGSGDGRLESGIINNDTLISGRHIIKSIRLPKNKFGSDGYFLNYNAFAYQDDLKDDAFRMLDSLYNLGEISFNRIGFSGTILIVFAGGSRAVGGQAYGRVCTMRSNLDTFYDTTKYNRIDGFRIAVHEMGHNAPFNFPHTNSGRYCTMNPNSSASHPDCPAHFNPYYKLIHGWLDVKLIDSTQEVTNLPPVETSHEVGLITIYGEPSAYPDWQTGEYFLVENRRLTGFDSKMNDHINFNGITDFKGGLLIYHYSPYSGVNAPSCNSVVFSNLRQELPLVSDHGGGVICNNQASPDHFYGYATDSASQPLKYKLDSNRTYSFTLNKTGIRISNIRQNHTTNSGVSFNVSYLISEPTHYDHVIRYSDTGPAVVNLDGKVYYHGQNNKYFNVLPGTIIENAPSVYTNYKGMEAKGTKLEPIIFQGCGYGNYREKTKPVTLLNYQNYLSIDSVILSNVEVRNPASENDIALRSPDVDIPFKFQNLDLQTTNSVDDGDILFTGDNTHPITIPGLDMQNYKVRIEGEGVFITDAVYLSDSKLILENTSIKLGPNVVINLTNSALIASSPDFAHNPITLDKLDAEDKWAGIYIDGSHTRLKNATFKNSLYGLQVYDIIDPVYVESNIFENNLFNDLNISYNIYNIDSVIIRKNNFHCSENIASSINTASLTNLVIDSNYFHDVGMYGIYMMNNTEPFLKANVLEGIDTSAYSSGILSQNSNGYYECNLIYNFNDYGIMLNASSPYLFSNELYGNGIGMYITNFSYPSMTSTVFNRIHYNGGEEIYCENDIFNISIPLMNKGENMIEDGNKSTNILIQNEYFGDPGYVINALSNYWNGSEPSVGRFNPAGCVDYSSWLTSNPTMSCIELSRNANGSNNNIDRDYILFDEAINELKNGSYAEAENKFKQIILSDAVSPLKIASANKLLDVYSLSKNNLNNLQDFYSMMQGNSQNKGLLKNLNNSNINAKVKNGKFMEAIEDCNLIIDNSKNRKDILNASIEKMSILNEALNAVEKGNTKEPEFYINEINKLLQQEFKKEILVEKNAKDKSSENNNDKLLNLRTGFKDLFNSSKTYSLSEYRNLLSHKILLALTEMNVKYDIPHKSSRLAFMHKDENAAVPLTFKLSQNYPNPFNPLTTINYEFPKDGFVKIKVYDILGKEVMTLVNENKTAGKYETVFNGLNFSSGVYFYRITVNDFVDTKRMVLIK